MINWEELALFKSIAIFPLIIGFIITFISIPAVIEIAKYFGLVDNPALRPHPAHTESRIIPRAGGLALLFGLLITTAIFIPFAKGIVGILLGAFLLVFIGLIDDKNDVPPKFRLVINIIAASLAVAGGAGIGFMTNPLNGTILHFDSIRWSFEFLGRHSILPVADLLAILWLTWAMNLVGWSSGVDGQMPGFVVIAAFVIGLLSFGFIEVSNFPTWTGTALAFITSGIYLGFLPWNSYPQKIMPGYGGKSLAGYLLGTLAILSSAKLGTAILVLGIPVIDAVYVIVNRILSFHNPLMPSRTHLHHRLLDAGFSKRQVALFYWIFSAILGAVALTVNSKQKFFAAAVLAVVVAGLILWLKFFTTFLKKSAPVNGSRI